MSAIIACDVNGVQDISECNEEYHKVHQIPEAAGNAPFRYFWVGKEVF